MIDCANPIPYAMRILCLLVSIMDLQGLDLILNPFQEWEDNMILIGFNTLEIYHSRPTYQEESHGQLKGTKTCIVVLI